MLQGRGINLARRGLLAVLPAVCLLLPATAPATPPTGLVVSQTSYRVSAAWGVDSGMASDSIEISESPDGAAPFITGDLAPAQTEYLSAELAPGTYYVRVAAVPEICPTPPCAREFSAIEAVTIPPPGPPTLLSAGQVDRRLTTTWTLAPGTESSLIEVATSPSTDADGAFVDLVMFDFPPDPQQTAYTFAEQVDPGEYYVHVAASDPFCPLDACPLYIFSDTIKVTVPPDQAAPAPPAAAPPPPTPTVPVDSITSFASLKCASIQRAGRLVVQASMPEDGTITVAGTMNVPGASKVFKLKAVTVTALAGQAVRIKVKIQRTVLKAVRRAVKGKRTVKARLTITARDGAGNRKVEKRTVRLRR